MKVYFFGILVRLLLVVDTFIALITWILCVDPWFKSLVKKLYGKKYLEINVVKPEEYI